MSYTPIHDDPLGVWQAWVEAAKTYDERRVRFDAVPRPMRSRVQSHMRTVVALERFHERRKARRSKWL
jgi:hypothetical protein